MSFLSKFQIECNNILRHRFLIWVEIYVAAALSALFLIFDASDRSSAVLNMHDVSFILFLEVNLGDI
jgi:hypothetical protein